MIKLGTYIVKSKCTLSRVINLFCEQAAEFPPFLLQNWYGITTINDFKLNLAVMPINAEYWVN